MFSVHYFLFQALIENLSLIEYGDVIIAGEGLQNLGRCSALSAFKEGGVAILPHQL
jgi:hypothetical protein